MSDDIEVAIQVVEDDLPAVSRLLSDEHIEFDLIENKKLLGGADLITVAFGISALVIRRVFALLEATIKAREHTCLIYKGVTIKGISEAKIREMMNRIDERHPGS